MELTPTDAEKMMEELGLDFTPPKAVLPIDAFRRLTGSARHEYELPDGARCTLDLHKAQAQDTMLVRHIVRTVTKAGVNLEIKRVGEAVFYKPARGKPQTSRMRLQVASDDPEVRRFVDALRPEYDKAVTYLDDQAARRLVRSYLSSVGAVHVGGPYLLNDLAAAVKLLGLFERLGGGSRCDIIEVADTTTNRAAIDGWSGGGETND